MSAYESFVGKSVIIRTVTHYYTGRLLEVCSDALVVEDAAWIADTGRWSVALTRGLLSEVEPYPDGPVIVSIGAIVDVALWGHELPRVAK